MTSAEFGRLYAQCGRRLFGLAWQLTGSVAEAEDAVQETCLRALRAAQAYEERGLGGAWLDRILLNVVREAGRRRSLFRRQVEPGLKVLAPEEASESLSPEVEALRSERTRAVLSALHQVPATFREVLVLRHFEERSTAEVALTLGLPEATVRTRLKRARDLILRLSQARVPPGVEDPSCQPIKEKS